MTLRRTVDTSVVVAAYASWHQAHLVARKVVDSGPALIAHTAVEAFSVLTRLPAPHRAPASLVVEFLANRFPDPWLTLPSTALRALLERAATSGTSGGAVYDAQIAATAAHHGLSLATLDARATETYRTIGVVFELL